MRRSVNDPHHSHSVLCSVLARRFLAFLSSTCPVLVLLQTVRLKSLFDEILGADTQYHLVGTSMGGWISVNFATLFPESVLSLSLLCPAGVQVPLSDERKAEFDGECRYI